MSSTSTDMTQGTIWKHLLSFALPMTVGLIFQQLYNTVDTIVVGQFVGKSALAAVGSTGPIINTIVGFAAGLSLGASVIISQAYGSKDYKALSDAVHTSISLTFIFCFIMTLIGILIVDPMLMFMDTPADVLADARAYLTIYFAGVSGVVMYNMGSGIMRAVGDSRRPLYFLIFSAVVNTVLDLLFVIAFKMGVAGVAYATIIANIFSAILILVVLTRDDGPYSLHWKQLRIVKASAVKIVKIGLPSAIQQAITAFSNVFVQGYINFFGSDVMAGYGVYNKLDNFLMIPAQAISMACTTFVGQNIGANDQKRAAKGVTTCLLMCILCLVVLSMGVVAFAPFFITLFSQDEQVIKWGVHFVRMISPFYVLVSFNQTYASALRGIGNSTGPMIAMLSSFVLFRQIYLFIVRNFLGNPLSAVVMGYPAGWLVCSVTLFLMYQASPLGRVNQQTGLSENTEN